MRDEKTTESDLAARLGRGDPAAVDELYRLYFHRLYSVVYYQVDRNQAVAEDIVQETFLAALRSARRFRGQSKVYTWLCGIAYHKVADHYRRKSREPHQRSTTIDIGGVDANANSGTPGISSCPIEAAENRSLIESAMSNLPPEYRQALLLKYVEDLSVVEISQIMQRSQKSVEGLLSRSKRAMQDKLSRMDN